MAFAASSASPSSAPPPSPPPPPPLEEALTLEVSILRTLLIRNRAQHRRTQYYRRSSMVLLSVRRSGVLDAGDLVRRVTRLREALTRAVDRSNREKSQKKKKEERWSLLEPGSPSPTEVDTAISDLLPPLRDLIESLDVRFPEVLSRILHASSSLFVEIGRGFFLPFCTISIGCLGRIRSITMRIGVDGSEEVRRCLAALEEGLSSADGDDGEAGRANGEVREFLASFDADERYGGRRKRIERWFESFVEKTHQEHEGEMRRRSKERILRRAGSSSSFLRSDVGGRRSPSPSERRSSSTPPPPNAPFEDGGTSRRRSDDDNGREGGADGGEGADDGDGGTERIANGEGDALSPSFAAAAVVVDDTDLGEGVDDDGLVDVDEESAGILCEDVDADDRREEGGTEDANMEILLKLRASAAKAKVDSSQRKKKDGKKKKKKKGGSVGSATRKRRRDSEAPNEDGGDDDDIRGTSKVIVKSRGRRSDETEARARGGDSEGDGAARSAWDDAWEDDVTDRKEAKKTKAKKDDDSKTRKKKKKKKKRKSCDVIDEIFGG